MFLKTFKQFNQSYYNISTFNINYKTLIKFKHAQYNAIQKQISTSLLYISLIFIQLW